MNREHAITALRIFIISLSCISGFVLASSLSLIVYDCYKYGNLIGIVLIIMAPVVLVSFLVMLITNAYAKKRKWRQSSLGLKTFGIAFVILTSTSIGCKIWLDSPAVVVHARYDGRHTMDLYLRKNMTAKLEETHMLGINEYYGNYHIKGDTLVLTNVDFRYCGNVLVDTMLFEKDYIRFLIADSECGIENTQMHILADKLH